LLCAETARITLYHKSSTAASGVLTRKVSVSFATTEERPRSAFSFAISLVLRETGSPLTRFLYAIDILNRKSKP
jgi:hypothetical protein